MDSTIKQLMKRLGLPEYIFISVVLIVLASFVLFYLVDLRNVFGLRDMLFVADWRPYYFPYVPFFFGHWGRNSGIAEILQFFLLSAAALISAFCAGSLYRQNKRLFGFWALISIALILMMLEDAGNIRHLVMSYVQAAFGEPDQGIAGTVTEFSYFSALAALPLYALIKYWREIKKFGKTKIYLLIGFSMYALAGSLPFLGTAFDYLLDRNFYIIAGEKFYNLAISIANDPELHILWQTWEGIHRHFPIGFHLMDSLVEENIELIGAGAFLAAAVSFALGVVLKSRGGDNTEIGGEAN